MKLNAGKRVLMFFHWLFSLLICAAFALYIIKPEWTMALYTRVTGGMSDTRVMIVGIAILAIYVILAVVQACIIFHRTKHVDRGFITVDSSDSGRVRIAVSAIEQMVRQSVTSIDGISDMKIAIENHDEAIAITIAAILQNGCHVPTVTMNMQHAIRQFVEMNCGVAVRSVSISINAVSNVGEGGRRRGRRKESAAPIEAPAPVYPVPNTDYDTPSEPEAQASDSEYTDSAPEYTESVPEAIKDETVEEAPVFIPDPGPITLHFDHLPEQGGDQFDQEAEPPAAEAEAPENGDDEL